MASLLPSPGGIAGPTAEWLPGIFNIPITQSILSLLYQVQLEDAETSSHAHVPLSKVFERLGSAAATAISYTKRQYFL